MKVAIYGMGYVGVVTSVCLAKDGHFITGIDLDADKVDQINHGKSPIIEPLLSEYMQSAYKQNKIKATINQKEIENDADIILISVGTPSKPTGEANLQYVYNVIEDISNALIKNPSWSPSIILRSTVPPGTCSNCLKLMNDKGLKVDFGYMPEFLREGSAIKDHFNPPFIIIGTISKAIINQITQLFPTGGSKLINTSMGIAEMLKSISNAWHAVKITFANEVGRLSSEIDINGSEVMKLITQDTKLNISSAYLKPGFAFGGSCLPKDVSSLEYLGNANNLDLPLLNSLMISNNAHIDYFMQKIIKSKPKKALLLGLSFKNKTDDLRGSPAIKLSQSLLKAGIKLAIYDEYVILSQLIGENKHYIDNSLPNIENMIINKDAINIHNYSTVIITYMSENHRSILADVPDNIKIFNLSGQD